MTHIEVYRRGAFLEGVCAFGHSGYAEAGSDIVCAAISVLMQTLYIGLAEVLHLQTEISVDEKEARIELRWKDTGSNALRVLAETVVRALRETARTYEDYVKFVEVSL